MVAEQAVKNKENRLCCEFEHRRFFTATLEDVLTVRNQFIQYFITPKIIH